MTRPLVSERTVSQLAYARVSVGIVEGTVFVDTWRTYFLAESGEMSANSAIWGLCGRYVWIRQIVADVVLLRHGDELCSERRCMYRVVL